MSLARAVGFAALGAFGLLHWMAMVDPAAPARAGAALAVAVAVALRPVLLIVAVPAVLLVAGSHPSDLLPWHWDVLFGSLGSGVEGVGGARIPYLGSDTDVRFAIVLGGAVLVVGAAVLARRSRLAGLVALGFLYGIPAVAVAFDLEFLRGALLAVLVLAYLRLERVRTRDLGPAVALAAVGCVVALAAAPALDADDPWFDYESFARDQAVARSAEFHWEHDYGGAIWARDGREVLQVDSPRRTYWKAETLDRFDGIRWTRDLNAGASSASENVGVAPDALRRWSFPISVSVRSLRSDTMPLATVAEDVEMRGLDPSLVSAGIWDAGRELHRGDSYRATVYVPDPTREQLEAAPPVYPKPVLESLAFDANVVADTYLEQMQVLVREFGEPPLADFYDSDYAVRGLRHSSLRRIWALSRELLDGAGTPYDYARAIQRRLGDGYTYDETPPRSAATLDGFLFDARSGYCQHYSGAMALLLRMGGVPARVATGFAPGSFDDRADRYVVRDLDAHSWVEAWFGGIGWVTFDPTPADAPPRSQALADAITAGVGDVRDRGTTQGPAPVVDNSGSGPLAPVGIVAALVLLAGLWTRRPRRATGSELERALRGAGLAVTPGMTLLGLEGRLGPGAADYLRAARTERYSDGPGPTPDDRRGLRRALTRGRGPLARLRTWLALAPHLH